MITFKEFLYENDQKLQATSLQMDDALSELNENASDASWMLTKNMPFYRGENSRAILEKIAETGFVIVDPSKTSRKSVSTSNYYTTIFDNIPSRKDFPKRSRSLIASTDETTAKGYTSSTPLRLIPLNGVKIGVVNKPDMWNTKLNKFYNMSKISVDDLNKIWQKIKDIDDSDWSSFLEFDKRLKAGDKKASEQLRQALYDSGWHFGRIEFTGEIPKQFTDFIEEVDSAYSPESTGHAWYTTKNLPHDLGNTEVWIGGPVMCISKNKWEELRQMV